MRCFRLQKHIFLNAAHNPQKSKASASQLEWFLLPMFTLPTDDPRLNFSDKILESCYGEKTDGQITPQDIHNQPLTCLLKYMWQNPLLISQPRAHLIRRFFFWCLPWKTTGESIFETEKAHWPFKENSKWTQFKILKYSKLTSRSAQRKLS